jgi:hypothetical protein
MAVTGAENAAGRKDVLESKEAADMFCPSCGNALSQNLKYCNRCGSRLAAAGEGEEGRDLRKRLDEYLDGLFWITVFGLGLILGGLALMKEVNLSDGLIIGYAALSSTAFIINFGLNLWETIRILRQVIKGKATGRLDTNELDTPAPVPFIGSAPTVTENTTHRLEPASKDRVSK